MERDVFSSSIMIPQRKRGDIRGFGLLRPFRVHLDNFPLKLERKMACASVCESESGRKRTPIREREKTILFILPKCRTVVGVGAGFSSSADGSVGPYYITTLQLRYTHTQVTLPSRT